MLNVRTAAIVLLTLLVAACGPTRTTQRPLQIPETVPAKIDFANKKLVKQVLYAQFDQWRAVKYKIGGLSKEGIDCSGFVYLTFNSRLGIALPRSTDLQVNVGKPVGKQELVPGDLVFFRTGKTTRHVGIYLEDGKFVHASTDRGVTISRLDDIYWSKVYWKSIRIPAEVRADLDDLSVFALQQRGGDEIAQKLSQLEFVLLELERKAHTVQSH